MGTAQEGHENLHEDAQDVPGGPRSVCLTVRVSILRLLGVTHFAQAPSRYE